MERPHDVRDGCGPGSRDFRAGFPNARPCVDEFGVCGESHVVLKFDRRQQSETVLAGAGIVSLFRTATANR